MDNISIYKGNELILNIGTSDNHKRKRVLMADNYVKLDFNYPDYIEFKKGSYILYENEKFEIMSNVFPEHNKETGGYGYSLQFDAQDGHLRRFNVFLRSNNIEEIAFALTTDIASFAQLVVDCINHELGTSWTININKIIAGQKTISFKGEKLFDACNMIADEFECEWWINGNVLSFGKLELGTEEIFRNEEVITYMKRKEGDSSNFGTRFYCYGSVRNLTSNYNGQSNTVNHISEIRLRLPNGLNYIDAYPNLPSDEIVHQTAFFEDVYPKNIDIVNSVEEIDRTFDNSDDMFTAYIIGANTPFRPEDIIEGNTLKCVFDSGDLYGREFELIISSPFNQKFEIKAITETSGDQTLVIPNTNIKPKIGDKFILTGVALPQERINEAEAELLQVATSWVEKNSKDTSVYECPSNIIYCTNNDKCFDLGQKVLLEGTGLNRSSRIIGYERSLYDKYDTLYTVGDNTSYSRLAQIEDSIKQSQYAERIGVNNGNGIYIISKYDNTSPTDFNVYSALKSDARFAQLLKDVEFNNVISKSFETKGFSPGPLGHGAGTIGSDIHADNFLARKSFTAIEWIISKMRHQGGQLILSGASGKITSVEDLDNGYKCYIETAEGKKQNEFTVGHQARCQEYTTQGKYYWRLVTAVGSDYVFLSKTDCDGAGIPEVGDELIGLGHRTNKALQGATILSSVNGQIGTFIYDGINSYHTEGKLISWQGVNGNERGGKFTGSLIIQGSSTGLKEFEEFEELYTIHISSDNGNLFTNGNVVTTLRAQVLEYATDITETLQDNQFYWKRVSDNKEQDLIWDLLHEAIGPVCTITSEDVHRKATFFCEVRIGNQIYKSK